MSNLFSDLQKVKEEQSHAIQNVAFSPSKEAETYEQTEPKGVVTSNSTRIRENPRNSSRVMSRDLTRNPPSRDEIQEFSFRLRDELKVKVQAEVPHEWQDELEDMARELDVKKLELYRYIIGAFLGKVKPQK